MDIPGRDLAEMTLDLSLGEFTALVTKALRGVGYPWGLATDGAHAARMLAQNGIDVGDIMVAFLHIVDAHTIRSLLVADQSDPRQAQCPIALGATMADLGWRVIEAPRVVANPVVQPLLLAPVLQTGAVVWETGRVDVDDGDIHFTGAAPVGAVPIELLESAERSRVGPASAQQSLKKSRVSLDNDHYRDLLTFAARTYAPATAESRISGAGAGTTNDD